ncbi:MAG: hypothetical protein ACFBZ8_06960 [Opitutales bacterium]
MNRLEALRQAYDGKFEWNEASGVLRFTESGRIDFRRTRELSGVWKAPTEVRRIAIAKNVQVTGQFTLRGDCTVEGEDRDTSVIYGTDTSGLLHDQGLDQFARCAYYSAVLGQGPITVKVQNLTTLNPVGFMWTGNSGTVMHLDSVTGIDNRGGWHNHSDGVSGAPGSTVRNCHLETGDDAIKAYKDITVVDTTICMIQNCVPIQLGWGAETADSKAVFRNLKIYGDHGRGQLPGVIVGRGGSYRRNIEIDGLELENPKAALVSLYEAGMELDLTIENAQIAVKQFWGESAGRCRSEINGSESQRATYEHAC